MRIAQTNLNDEGGAFSFIYEIEKQLNGKEQFDYYTLRPFGREAVIDDIKSMGGSIHDISASTRFLSNLLLPFRFYKIMKREKCEVVHANSDTAWKLSLYAIPAKLAGVKKVIVHSHSSGVNGDVMWLKTLCHVIMRPILPLFSDVMLSCSDKATSWMYPKLIRERTHVLRCGVDLDRFSFKMEEREKYRKELGIEDSEILMVVVGNLSYQKNPYFLIDVFNEVSTKDGRYKLLLLGDGKDRAEVEKYAGKKRNADKMIFYGATPNVAEMLNAADIFFMPSRFEGLPVSAIEAQTNGLFCIFADKITREIEMKTEGRESSCVFWDINENPKLWAERIVKINTGFSPADRSKGRLIAKKNGYDIKDIARKLERIYRR